VSTHTENIYKAVYKILHDALTPLGSLSYVKDVIEGWKNRDDIPAFPVIILEPADEKETRYSVPYRVRGIYELTIIPFMAEYNPAGQIVGAGSTKGIQSIVSDIKNLLSIDKSLGGTALKFEFPSCPYRFEFYPNRFAELKMEIEYITQDTQR